MRRYWAAETDVEHPTDWVYCCLGAGGPVARATAHSTGESRMNNPEITAFLELTVLAIAVAQVLTILLTIYRERDIKELRELVDEQRLRIVELRAWLAGRNAVQPRRIKFQSEPIREPTGNNTDAPEPAITPKGLPEVIQPRATEDEAAQAMKLINGQRDIIAGLITPKDLPDTIRPSTTEDELKRATNGVD
jgi:hypothetical protein